MLGFIYCAKNLINNKIYIGQTTTSLKRRISGHYHSANTNDKLYFHRALRKYNKEDFEWIVLKEIEAEKDVLKDLLNYWEVYYIELYHSNNSSIGYNMTSGGDAHQEQSETFWKSSEGAERKNQLSDYWTSYWSDDTNRENHKQWMNDFYKSDEGIAQANRHSDWMFEYYNGENARLNKSKTSKWFIEAISPDNEKLIFISSKEPNIYFNRDIGLRTMLKNVGDIWEPSKRSNLYGWKFKAIEKNYELL